MQPLSTAPPPLPVAWSHVLDQVDETLRGTEAAAAQREQAMSAMGSSSEAKEERLAQWQQSLHTLEAQMKRWPMARQEADQEALEADGVLHTGEEALRRWLAAAEVLERGLAKWVKPEV